MRATLGTVGTAWPPRSRRWCPARPAHGHRRAGDDYGVSDQPDWRTIDWVAHQHRIQVAGTEVNYVDIGEGDQHPIVFIHGLGGQWQNWLENIPRFAQDRRVIVPDLPGFGLLADARRGRSRSSSTAACVADLCDQLELGPCVVVGNSMGGYIASEVAIDRPRPGRAADARLRRRGLADGRGQGPGDGRDQGRRAVHRHDRRPAARRRAPPAHAPLGAPARGPLPGPAGARTSPSRA